MRPSSEKKLQEWVENAKHKGLDPNARALYINIDCQPLMPHPPCPWGQKRA
jgi:hypothetical protein